jgi:hypothetical protein
MNTQTDVAASYLFEARYVAFFDTVAGRRQSRSISAYRRRGIAGALSVAPPGGGIRTPSRGVAEALALVSHAIQVTLLDDVDPERKRRSNTLTAATIILTGRRRIRVCCENV